jgi:hypothetical protein
MSRVKRCTKGRAQWNHDFKYVLPCDRRTLSEASANGDAMVVRVLQAELDRDTAPWAVIQISGNLGVPHSGADA